MLFIRNLYLLLYQASSRSNINRKFFSSGRLNWSH